MKTVRLLMCDSSLLLHSMLSHALVCPQGFPASSCEVSNGKVYLSGDYPAIET